MDMYKRVLEDKLVFPSQFDAVTRNLLSGVSYFNSVFKKLKNLCLGIAAAKRCF